ncbi:hypothetical protein EDC04DRAFT_1098000 [Pisolithus marmoratus]|nr:hypothetical protein EDC04DRAFT_1098000 [Pisolithus marmoratus]
MLPSMAKTTSTVQCASLEIVTPRPITDKCSEPIWLLGVQHPGYEPPPPTTSDCRASVECVTPPLSVPISLICTLASCVPVLRPEYG